MQFRHLPRHDCGTAATICSLLLAGTHVGVQRTYSYTITTNGLSPACLALQGEALHAPGRGVVAHAHGDELELHSHPHLIYALVALVIMPSGKARLAMTSSQVSKPCRTAATTAPRPKHPCSCNIALRPAPRAAMHRLPTSPISKRATPTPSSMSLLQLNATHTLTPPLHA